MKIESNSHTRDLPDQFYLVVYRSLIASALGLIVVLFSLDVSSKIGPLLFVGTLIAFPLIAIERVELRNNVNILMCFLLILFLGLAILNNGYVGVLFVAIIVVGATLLIRGQRVVAVIGFALSLFLIPVFTDPSIEYAIWIRSLGVTLLSAIALVYLMRNLSAILLDLEETTQKLSEAKEAAERAATELTDRNNKLEWIGRVLDATQRVANIGSFNTELRTDKQWYSYQIRGIFGYAPMDHFDRDLWITHIHPEDVDEVIRATNEIFIRKEANTSRLAYRIFTTDGSLRWIEVTWSYDFDELGEISFIEGSVQDITDRQESQTQQLELERGQTDRYRELWSTLLSVERVAKIGSWSMSLANNQLVWSDETRRIHEVAEDFEPSVETGINFYEAGKSREKITRAVEQALETGEGWDLELAIVTAKGNKIWVRARGETEFENGKCVRLFGVFQDISERHNHEQALKAANEKAEQASKMKSEFLANMSHEIRTPMNAVLGLAQVLTRKNKYAPDVVEHASKIVRAGQSLQNLLNDILDLSKIESGKLTLHKMPIRLVEMQENLALLMSNSARDKQIELIIEPLEHPETEVIADQLRLEQVLVNLIGNAIKFTESGYVSLRLAVDESDHSPDQVQLLFEVADTGIGISEEQIQRILEPFTQADASITRRFGGTGLGLGISQRLLDLMDSTLSIKSELGVGTVVSFTLVLERSLTIDTKMHQPVSALDVLVVDDHEIARDAISRTAKSLGWRPTAASGGVSAIELYKAQVDRGEQIGLILIDWMMPDIDGASTARQIKEYASLAGAQHSPTIIMVTAHAQEQVEQSPDFDCIDLVVNKPVTAASLRNAYLAIDDKQNLMAKQVSRAENALKGKTLLVVDDNLFNRDVARIIFEAEGARVVMAEDGQQAINWLQNNQNRADAVLMDVQMPVLDGLDATMMLRKQERFASLPIIGMSAGAYKADVEMAMLAGMDAYITKPIDVSSAVQTVAEQLGVSLQLDGEKELERLTGLNSEGEVSVEQSALELFDANAGVEFWGSEPRLAEYLKRFIVEFTATLDPMNGLASRMNLADLHKLKGAAGTIYLNRLASTLNAAEDCVKNGRQLDEVKSELLSVWKQTASVITPFIDQFAPVENVADGGCHIGDKTIPEASLISLREALATCDPDEVDEVLGPLLEHYPSAVLREVELAAKRFDFSGASAHLNRILKR